MGTGREILFHHRTYRKMIRSYHTPERIRKICRKLILENVFAQYGSMRSWYRFPETIKNIFAYFNEDGTVAGAFVILQNRQIRRLQLWNLCETRLPS